MQAAKITEHDIAALASGLREDLSKEIGRIGTRLPLRELIAFLHRRDGLVVRERILGRDVAGMIRFGEGSGEITLDQAIAISPMASFTLAHEVGHWLLHRDHGNELVTLRRDLRTSPNPLEHQANRFAVHLLMPADLIQAEFNRRYGTASQVFAEQAPGMQERWARRRDYSKFKATKGQHISVPSLVEEFGVSPAAMAIRLEELGLV